VQWLASISHRLEQVYNLSHDRNEGHGKPDVVAGVCSDGQRLPGPKFGGQIALLHFGERPSECSTQHGPEERADDREFDASRRHGYTSLRLLKAENTADAVRSTRALVELTDTNGAVIF
jgi:hypothetical protein